MLIHRLYLLMAEESEPDPGLVRYDKEEITAFQSLKGGHCISKEDDIGRRAEMSPVLNQRPIAIEKDCGLRR